MFPIRDHNPSGRPPYVTYGLVFANVAIFVLSLLATPDARAADRFFYDWGMIPVAVVHGKDWSGLVTSMFLHGGWMHLAGNMLFLWIFGNNVEDAFGHRRFLLFYLAGGLAAAAGQILMDPTSEVPMVGASGAIAAVLGSYLLLFPKARVDILIIIVIFFRVLPVPAWIVLGIWFGLQLFNGLALPTTADGVAYWAHIGGFVAGVVLTVPLWREKGGVAFWRRTHGAPPHPEAAYRMARTHIPPVTRQR